MKSFSDVTFLSAVPIETVLNTLKEHFDAEVINKEGRANRWAVIINDIEKKWVAEQPDIQG